MVLIDPIEVTSGDVIYIFEAQTGCETERREIFTPRARLTSSGASIS
jgi:hypothetical protein